MPRPFFRAMTIGTQSRPTTGGFYRTMKATIERATLLKSLGHVQSVVERRNTIPILSNVLIEALDGGGIRLMATDLDLQILETIDAQVEQAGATTISAHTLFDIARKLPEGAQVSLAAAEGKMAVNAGRARFNLSTLPRDDFPVIAEGNCRRSSSFPPLRCARSSTRRALPFRPRKRAIISMAFFCMWLTMP